MAQPGDGGGPSVGLLQSTGDHVLARSCLRAPESPPVPYQPTYSGDKNLYKGRLKTVQSNLLSEKSGNYKGLDRGQEQVPAMVARGSLTLKPEFLDNFLFKLDL